MSNLTIEKIGIKSLITNCYNDNDLNGILDIVYDLIDKKNKIIDRNSKYEQLYFQIIEEQINKSIEEES